MPRIGVGLGLGLSPLVVASAGYDADAQAFFDRVTTAGGTLTTTEKNATNQLVLDMKSAGIWTPMKAIYPMVGASAAACAQNLKSSSFTGTFSSGWTFASTGVKGNGMSTYMSTALNMLTQQPSSANVGVYFRTNNTSASTYPIAWAAVSSPIFNYLGGPQWQDSYLGTTSTNIVNNATYTGFFQRSASIGVNNRRRNNTSQGTNTVSYTAANDTMLLGINNTDSTNAEVAFFCIGDYITTTQQDNFYTAVQAFQTTLNRYVDAPWYNNGNLLLDLYPSAAAAYSVRKLRNNYIGGPIRVRRSSDNAEQDIYFDANGNLDTAQLTSFCSGTNGFVTTWYDQSGNGLNVTQTTAINQPQIVSSGVVVLSNSKPSMFFDATNDILQRTSPDSEALAMNIHSSVFVHQVGSVFSNYYSVIQRRQSNSGSPTNYSPLGLNSAGRTFYAWNGSAETYSSVSYAVNIQYLENYIGNTTAGIGSMKLFRNNTNVLTANNSMGTKSIPTLPVFTVGNWTNELTQKYVQEIVIWATDQSSNISAINTSVNTFYNVY